MEEALSNASPTIYGTSSQGRSIAQGIIILLMLRACFVYTNEVLCYYHTEVK